MDAASLVPASLQNRSSPVSAGNLEENEEYVLV